MKILLAGPGTGKTTKIKDIIKSDYPGVNNVLVLSFTNATISDLKNDFKNNKDIKCYTLHSYALKINHLPDLYILEEQIEKPIIQKYSEKLEIDFDELCSMLGCITFNKMISNCVKFLKSNPVYAKENIGNLDLLIVDEFQDFNETERNLVYQIASFANDTIILGDDDQSIYDFKDADPDGIIDLYKDKDVHKIQHENKCYRCPDQIVENCSKLISKNRHRVVKQWSKTGKAGDVIFVQKMTHDETHEYICNEIKNNIPSGSSILILSRVHYYIEDLVSKLKNEKIEYVNIWNTNITYDLLEKVWWLNLLYGEHKSLFLLLLSKKRKLNTNKSYITKLKDIFKSGYSEESFIENVKQHYSEPYLEYLTASISISKFFELYPEFNDLKEIVEEDDLKKSISELKKNLRPTLHFQKDRVNVMSIHKSKGLQAKYVFIIGLTDGIVPDEIRGTDSIEAFRRLVFVGMTRALDRLYMVSTIEWAGKWVNKHDKKKFKYDHIKKVYRGKTSRFIDEMRNE